MSNIEKGDLILEQGSQQYLFGKGAIDIFFGVSGATRLERKEGKLGRPYLTPRCNIGGKLSNYKKTEMFNKLRGSRMSS